MTGLLIAVCLSLLVPQPADSCENASASDVAKAFAIAYEAGDPSAADYVFFTGKHVPEMGGTPEELRDELLPAELRKHRKDPAEVIMEEIRFSPMDNRYGHDVYYVVYLARGTKHTLCLHQIERAWKVDISYLWMGDWYDWMPGY